MNIWGQFPLIRLIIPFIAGVILAIFLPLPIPYLLLIISSLIIIISIIVFLPKLIYSYKNTWIFGILLQSTLFLSAYQFTLLKTEKLSANHFSNYCDSTQFVYAKLVDPIIEKPKSVKAVMEIMSVKSENKWKQTRGKAMIYLFKDSASLHLRYGDELILNANFHDVPPPQNPGEFDYKRFLSFHNINQQAYLKAGDWVKLGRNSGNPVYVYANNLQHKLLTIFTENNINGNEFAVGAALLLGYTDKLDADIIQAYASTGALHVLSVSGLHVAIIYVVLNWLLFFFDKFKYGNILKAIILLLFIWFYAMLTGLSPAVLRSAAMLSLIIIAKAYKRKTNIYNTLAASVFILLLYNPYLIMDVGFQLSYLAVIGIVFIQPKIDAWINTENWWWLFQKIWELMSVSLAAQLVTFPLGLHYFHQFPNYFLLSNFIVIPISTLIMYLGISVFVFVKVPLLVKYVALCFNYCIWILNFTVTKIERFPYSLIQGISINIFETWIIYGVILIFIYYFMSRKFKYLAVSLSLLVVLLVSLIQEQYAEYHQRKLIVYNIPKSSAIDFIDGKSNVFLSDTAIIHNESSLLFHVKHNWWNLGLNETKMINDSFQSNHLSISGNCFQFFNKKIIRFEKSNTNKLIDKLNVAQLPIDYLLITKNPSIRIESLLKLYSPKLIIFDSSNSKYHLIKWTEECRALNRKFYSVSDSGALIIDI